MEEVLENGLEEIDSSNSANIHQSHVMNSTIFYLITQYFYAVFVFFVYVLASFSIVQSQKPKIRSAKYISFDKSINPTYFAHITDTHVNHAVLKSQTILNDTMNYLSSIHAPFLINTGDVADNDKATQYIDDYKLYNTITAGKDLIQIAGNHDMYNVVKYKESNFFKFTPYYDNKNEQEFWSSIVKMNDITFNLVNLVDLPQMGARFSLLGGTTNQVVDKLQKDIEEPAKYRFVLTHYPAYMLSFSIGSDLRKLYSSSNIDLILVGHIHPKGHSHTYHVGENLQIAGGSLRHNNYFGLVTIDNDAVVYHDSFIHTKGVVTNPVPLKQVTKKTCFSRQQSEIRLLFFGSKDAVIQVNGAVKGKLAFQREISPNVSLFSLPYSLSNGHYQLVFSGDFSDTIEFVIGDEVDLPKERYLHAPTIEILLITLTAVLTVSSIMLLIPIHLKIPTDSYWSIFLFAGFLRKSRIDTTPKWARIAFFCFALYPVVFPTAITSAEGITRAIWTYGYIADGKSTWNMFGVVFSSVYYVFILYPGLFLLSALSFSLKMHIGLAIDIGVAIFCLILLPVIYAAMLYPVCMKPWFLLTPGFLFIPILEIIVLWFARQQMKKSDKYGVLTEDAIPSGYIVV